MSNKVIIRFMVFSIAVIVLSCAGSKNKHPVVDGNLITESVIDDDGTLSIKGRVIYLDSTAVYNAIVSTEPHSRNALSDKDGYFTIVSSFNLEQEYTFIAKPGNGGHIGQTKIKSLSDTENYIYIVIGKTQRIEPDLGGDNRPSGLTPGVKYVGEKY